MTMKAMPPYTSASYSSEILSGVMLEIMCTSHPYKQNFMTWNIKATVLLKEQTLQGMWANSYIIQCAYTD
jgi:hypothetical protein